MPFVVFMIGASARRHSGWKKDPPLPVKGKSEASHFVRTKCQFLRVVDFAQYYIFYSMPFRVHNSHKFSPQHTLGEGGGVDTQLLSGE